MCVCLSVCMVKRRNVKENQLSLLFNLAKKLCCTFYLHWFPKKDVCLYVCLIFNALSLREN